MFRCPGSLRFPYQLIILRYFEGTALAAYPPSSGRHVEVGGLSAKSKSAMSFISMGDVDLLHPPRELEQRRHKLKRLVQSPNSFFMDVKCPGCFNITTVFSHAQTVVLCGSCSTVLCQPTGGKARLTEGCSFRKKVE